jgi:hypothetical protein
MSIATVILTQPKVGLPIQTASQMHSPTKQVSGTTPIQMVMVIILSTLMAKHGVNHSVAIVAKQQLDIQLLIVGVVPILMVTVGQIQQQIGWLARAATAMLGLSTRRNGPIEMEMEEAITRKEPQLMFVLTTQALQSGQQKAVTGGVVLTPMVMDGRIWVTHLFTNQLNGAILTVTVSEIQQMAIREMHVQK